MLVCLYPLSLCDAMVVTSRTTCFIGDSGTALSAGCAEATGGTCSSYPASFDDATGGAATETVGGIVATESVGGDADSSSVYSAIGIGTERGRRAPLCVGGGKPWLDPKKDALL